MMLIFQRVIKSLYLIQFLTVDLTVDFNNTVVKMA